MSRISLIFLLPMGLCVGFLFDNSLLRASGRRRLMIGGLFVVFTVGEQWNVNHYGFSKAQNEQRLLSLRALIGTQCGVFYFKGHGEPDFMTHVDAMLVSQSIGVPTLNGYSGGEHPEYVKLGLGRPATVDPSAPVRWLNFWQIEPQGLCVL